MYIKTESIYKSYQIYQACGLVEKPRGLLKAGVKRKCLK